MNQQAFQTKAEIIKAIENNFIEWLTFQGKLTNSDYFETDEIKRVMYELPFPLFNNIIWTNTTEKNC